MYAAPTAFACGSIAMWRKGKVVGFARTVATTAGIAGLVFPVLCLIAIRLKA